MGLGKGLKKICWEASIPSEKEIIIRYYGERRLCCEDG